MAEIGPMIVKALFTSLEVQPKEGKSTLTVLSKFNILPVRIHSCLGFNQREGVTGNFPKLNPSLDYVQ